MPTIGEYRKERIYHALIGAEKAKEHGMSATEVYYSLLPFYLWGDREYLKSLGLKETDDADTALAKFRRLSVVNLVELNGFTEAEQPRI